MIAGKTIRKKAASCLNITLLCTGLVWLALHYKVLQRYENASWDVRMGFIAQKHAPDPRIKIIKIDQASIDYFLKDTETWPWHRGMYRRVNDFLTKSGAKAVAFDILFTEFSMHGVADDLEFASGIRDGLPTVLAVNASDTATNLKSEEFRKFKLRQNEFNLRFQIESRFLGGPRVPQFVGASPPVSELIDSASLFGNVFALPDRDGVFRHYVPGGYVKDLAVIGLPVALFSLNGGDVRSIDEKFFDSEGRLTIRFAGQGGAYKSYSILDVIQSMANIDQGVAPILPLSEFKDSLVLVGMTAPGLLDLRPTPVNDKCPGVEVNATVLDNLLNSNFIRKPSIWLASSVCLVFVALISIVCIFPKSTGVHALSSILLLGGFLLFVGIVGIQGWWFPAVVPFLGMVLAMCLAFSVQYQLEGREHRFIKGAFKHYVTPSVIDKIVDDPSALSLGGEKRELSIFFSDIQGFTSISEKLEANKLVGLINLFLTEMTDIILEAGGTVDKYVGDAIVAFWNAPISISDHAVRAVQAAIACQQKLESLQSKFLEEFGVPVKMRIGIHTGVVSVGNFGSRERFNYTIIGDSANLASRLEGANKYFGTYILISEETQKAVKDAVYCRRIGEIRVVGRNEPVAVFEPMPTPQPESQLKQNCDSFERALVLYGQREFEQAQQIWLELKNDPPSQAYLKRVQNDLKEGSQGEHWSAVWNLTEK